MTRVGCLGLALVACVAACAAGEPGAWPDWRGPRRAGLSRRLPDRLPAEARFLWRRALTGMGLSGVAATARHVVVADKSKDKTQDVWRCLDADTGREHWRLTYPAAGEMDYSNSPRANPVIHDGRVYLLGAFGHLHCVELATGKVVWKRHIISDFGARLPQWGACSTPLVVDDKLIVNPGAERASLVALDRRTGNELWRTPGPESGYGSLIVGEFGGVRQIVGHDCKSLGGWDPATGRRLWTLTPEYDGDFNVPTPVAVDGRLLVSTENNGTRLYRFRPGGVIDPKPMAVNEDLSHDTISPVVIDGLVFSCCGDLMCLDLAKGLKTAWRKEDGAFEAHASLIAGAGRVLVSTGSGELVLFDATAKGYVERSRLRLFKETEIWSHPALVGDRLYIRGRNSAACVLLGRP